MGSANIWLCFDEDCGAWFFDHEKPADGECPDCGASLVEYQQVNKGE